jgi:hypothetical protein
MFRVIFPVPGQDGLGSDDVRHLFQSFSAQPLADLGQGDALVVRQAEPTFELIPEDSVFSREILVALK